MQDYSNYDGPPPKNLMYWGPESQCNLDNCPLRWSIYTYRPSLAANVFFIVAFAMLNLVHIYLGIRWRSWGFMIGMILGCTSEIIGYVGRLMMWGNPFSFNGFMVQIVCLTIAPVFYTASIYVTLSKTIIFFAPEYSRFRPQLFYWIFIPLDIACLILQAAGGAMSTDSDGSDNTGVHISMAGLILQVIVIGAFIAAFMDYMVRYLRSGKATAFGWRVKAFFAGITISILLILGRCAYRVAELREGYSGELVKRETEFIVLEGAFIVVACAALCFGHPGLGFKSGKTRPTKEKFNSEESNVAISEPQADWDRV